jgi:hypothetical protein
MHRFLCDDVEVQKPDGLVSNRLKGLQNLVKLLLRCLERCLADGRTGKISITRRQSTLSTVDKTSFMLKETLDNG